MILKARAAKGAVSSGARSTVTPSLRGTVPMVGGMSRGLGR